MANLVLTMTMSLDGFFLTVHPVALGSGKRIFTGKTSLELIDARTVNIQVVESRPCVSA